MRHLVLTLCCVALACGCSGKKSPQVFPDVNDGPLNLAAIEDVGRGFYVKHKRYAHDVAELVAEKYLGRMPDVPAGKKIVIDQTTGHVTLANE